MKNQHQYIALIVCFLLVLLQAGKFLQHLEPRILAAAENRSSIHTLHDPHSEPEINNNHWTHGAAGCNRTQGGLALYTVSELNHFQRTMAHKKVVARQNSSFVKDYLLLIYPSHNFW